MDVTAVDGLSWLLATLAVGAVAVLLAGRVARRLPLRRGRWLAAALGFLAFSLALPRCATTAAGAGVRAECSAVLGRVGFTAGSPATAGLVVSALLGVALAVGVAPLVLPVLRARRERAQRDAAG